MITWSYATPEQKRPLVGMTVGQVIEYGTEKFGDHELLLSCYQGISKTFTQLNKETTQVAAGLLYLGFKPGDRIGIWGPNSYEWAITMFAAAKSGLILVNINPAYRPEELKYCLNKVQVRGIICATQYKSSNYYNILSALAPEILVAKPSAKISIEEVPSLEYVITMEDQARNGTFNFKKLFEGGRAEDDLLLEELKTKIQFDDACSILFTSGTTGNPKAAVYSHFNMVNNARFSGARNGFENNIERVALCVPFFHCLGSVIGILANVFYGSTTILPSPGFDPVATVKAIREDRVTSCIGTPTMFIDLLKEYKKDPFEITHLHTGIMSGAPCPESLLTAIMTDLKMKDFMVLFGMTETIASFQSSPNDSPIKRITSVGYPMDQIEAKVVDEDGRIVPVGVPGELYVRGYSVFLGYWGDEEKTKKSLQTDRWFKTGDLVIMDENRYLKIVGRKTDMIIRGGENIYPAEVENFFMKHHSIIEAQVVGVPDERLGQEAAMWVKTADINLTAEEIRNWAKEKVSYYKIPKYVLIKDVFPTNLMGKVKKFVMREETIKSMSIRGR